MNQQKRENAGRRNIFLKISIIDAILSQLVCPTIYNIQSLNIFDKGAAMELNLKSVFEVTLQWSFKSEKGRERKSLQKAQEFIINIVNVQYRSKLTFSTSQPSWFPFLSTLVPKKPQRHGNAQKMFPSLVQLTCSAGPPGQNAGNISRGTISVSFTGL